MRFLRSRLQGKRWTVICTKSDLLSRIILKSDLVQHQKLPLNLKKKTSHSFSFFQMFDLTSIIFFDFNKFLDCNMHLCGTWSVFLQVRACNLGLHHLALLQTSMWLAITTIPVPLHLKKRAQLSSKLSHKYIGTVIHSVYRIEHIIIPFGTGHELRQDSNQRTSNAFTLQLSQQVKLCKRGS